MRIKVVCIGKLKEKYWQDACSEYLKRLSKYSKTSVEEVLEEKIPNETASYIEIAKKAEGERILKKVNPNDYVVLLEISGQQINSVQLANLLDDITIKGHSTIVFVIGGSYGVSEEVKKRANYKLSFSKLTFPHQMARIMVLEQIYRSFKINNNEKYHK